MLGREFEPEFLAKIAACSNDRVTAALRRARDLQLVVERAGATVRYAFRHTLFREVLYRELLAAEAKPLHARIAAELEQGEGRSAERTVELAYHWWAAGNAPKALRYNMNCGDAAVALGALNDAVVFYERALEHAEEATEVRAELHEKLADALYNVAAPSRALRAFQQALVYYESAGNVERVAQLCRKIGNQYWALTEAQESLNWYLRAVSAARNLPDSPVFHETLVHTAGMYTLRSDAENAWKYLEEAAQFAGTPNSRAVEMFYGKRMLANALRGQLTQAIADGRKSVELATEIGEPGAVARSRINLGYVALRQGLNEVAFAAFEDALGTSDGMLFPFIESYALGAYAKAQFRTGNLDRARELLERALPLVTEIESPMFWLQATAIAIPVGLRLQLPALVRQFADEKTIEMAFRSGEGMRIGPVVAAFVELYLNEGKIEAARALLHRGVTAIGHGLDGQAMLLLTAAHGDAADIALARELLLSWAMPAESHIGRAHLALFDALVAHSLGEMESVSGKALEAESSFEELQRPYEQALALELAGNHAAAHVIYARIGDRRDAQRLEMLLATPNRRGRAKSDLTEREREVAALVAGGKSNRAIAAELVISERTVENHLASIFSKLGISSRLELMAQIVREAAAAR